MNTRWLWATMLITTPVTVTIRWLYFAGPPYRAFGNHLRFPWPGRVTSGGHFNQCVHGPNMFASTEILSLCLSGNIRSTVLRPSNTTAGACVSTVITPALGCLTHLNACSPTGHFLNSPCRMHIRATLISVIRSTSMATRSSRADLGRAVIGAPRGSSSVAKIPPLGTSGSKPPRCLLRTPRVIQSAIDLGYPSRSTEGPSP